MRGDSDVDKTRWDVGNYGARGDDRRLQFKGTGSSSGDRGQGLYRDTGLGAGKDRDFDWRNGGDESYGAGREGLRPRRLSAEAHRDASAEKQLYGSERPLYRGQDPVHWRRRKGHQAGGNTEQFDHQVRFVRFRFRSARSGAG